MRWNCSCTFLPWGAEGIFYSDFLCESTVKWLIISGGTWWRHLQECFPTGSHLLNNKRRWCMMKKQKALPASVAPFAKLLLSVLFLSSLSQQISSEIFFQQSPGHCLVLPPCLQPGTAWLWLLVLNCNSMFLRYYSSSGSVGEKYEPSCSFLTTAGIANFAPLSRPEEF